MALRKRSRVWRCRRRKQRRSLSRNDTFLPQQRKLMGSSAQNSSGVHWCRRRVRFNQVPEKVPKVPKKVWEGGGLGSFGAEPGQVQQGSGEGPGEGSRKPWCKAKSGPTGFQRRFRRRSGKLWCSQVIPKVPGEGLGGFGAEPGQAQQTGFRRRFRRRFQKPWCKAKSSSMGSGEGLGGFGAQPGQVQQGFGEGSGEGLGGLGSGGSGEGVGGFGAEPGQVQQGSGEGSGEGSGLRCRAMFKVSEKV